VLLVVCCGVYAAGQHVVLRLALLSKPAASPILGALHIWACSCACYPCNCCDRVAGQASRKGEAVPVWPPGSYVPFFGPVNWAVFRVVAAEHCAP
jgi:hypothetical protein